jgi:hypothetical protein
LIIPGELTCESLAILAVSEVRPEDSSLVAIDSFLD